MALVNLSDDEILMVIDACLDRTLAQFALTCRRVHRLSKSTLTRREAVVAELKKWHTVDMTDNNYRATELHPIEVIAKIRDNPRIANWITRLEYNPKDEDSVEYLLETQSPDIEDLIKSCNYLEDEIDAFEFLGDDEKESWKNAVRRTNPNVCFLILLSLCKNAQELSMTDPEFELEGALDCFDSVIRHMRAEEAKQPGKYAETGVIGHFPAILKLELLHGDTELGLSFAAAWPILRIPSLLNFWGHMLGNEFEYVPLDWPEDLNDSKIQTFSLNYSYIHPNTIIELLGRLPRLKVFTYDDRHGYQQYYNEQWSNIQEYAEYLEKDGQEFLKERAYNVTVEKLDGSQAVVVRASDIADKTLNFLRDSVTLSSYYKTGDFTL